MFDVIKYAQYINSFSQYYFPIISKKNIIFYNNKIMYYN